MTVADLELAIPWLHRGGHDLGNGLVLRRGSGNVLTYEDGISLNVRVLEPRRFESVDELIREIRRDPTRGQVTLVAGSIPLEWRSTLRAEQISFVDVSGVAEINWPRLRVRASRSGQQVKRRRAPVPMQKGHALVAQATLIGALSSGRPTVSDVAAATGTSRSTASRTINQLASYGLVAKEREGKAVRVRVVDMVELAALLADRTAWASGPVLLGYAWGRSVWDTASRVSERADALGIGMAVTGRVGAAFLGVVGTSSPERLRCWVSSQESLAEVAEQLEIESAPPDEANLEISVDRWGVGLYGATNRSFDQWRAMVAHPVRVWCDLHVERRGVEFADQIWSRLTHAGRQPNGT